MTYHGQQQHPVAELILDIASPQSVNILQDVYEYPGPGAWLSSTYSTPPSYPCLSPSPPPHPPSPPSLPPPPANPNVKSKRFLYRNWRTGVVWCALAAFTVFLINLSLTLWAIRKFHAVHGLGSTFEGSCSGARKRSSVIHLVINALSAILLGSSNYCMQCLAAPTRSEVDKAHAKRLWVDIGVPSVRNLRVMSWGRIVLWFCLGASSIPLHLIYNSAVFSTQSTNLYYVSVVPGNFLSAFLAGEYKDYIPEISGYERGDPNKFDRLDKKACMKTYGVQFLSSRRDVIVIVDGNGTDWVQTDSSNKFHVVGYTSPINVVMPFDWICKSANVLGLCNVNDAISNIGQWKMEGGNVQFCLSEPWAEKCSLGFSVGIMTAVIICNLVKCTCMALVLVVYKEPSLGTLGDAITSFLETPDKTTVNMCISSKKDIQKGNWDDTERPRQAVIYKAWHRRRCHWFRAVSFTRWTSCVMLSLVGMGVVVRYLIIGLNGLAQSDVAIDLVSLWNMGFGKVNVLTLTGISGNNRTGIEDLIFCAMVANIPQLILSFLYLIYNSIFTGMLLGQEWDSYSYQRKSLRVTDPAGGQRSTYFLTIPYRYSISLIVASGTMHWIISQSIFLARVDWYFGNVIGDEPSSAVGFSPIAVCVGLFFGILMLFWALTTGFTRYSGGIPLAGSCSAAISAACHPVQKEFSDALLPLQWGVVDVDGDIGHCTFSSGPVSAPLPEGWYAGKTDSGARKRAARGG